MAYHERATTSFTHLCPFVWLLEVVLILIQCIVDLSELSKSMDVFLLTIRVTGILGFSVLH